VNTNESSTYGALGPATTSPAQASRSGSIGSHSSVRATSRLLQLRPDDCRHHAQLEAHYAAWKREDVSPSALGKTISHTVRRLDPLLQADLRSRLLGEDGRAEAALAAHERLRAFIDFGGRPFVAEQDAKQTLDLH
jgi:hypothetical protein